MFPHNNEGRNELLSIYDTNTLQDIVNNGCESGVCFKHIYYADTLTFFDKYEAEILDLIHIRYGVDTLVDIFKQHDADYDAYRNDCCWLFIENVATDIVTTLEEESIAEDQLIESYMQPVSNYVEQVMFGKELQQSAEDLKNLSVYNPPKSMTLNRYSHS